MKSDSLLVQTFQEAMRIWTAQKAEGVSKADRVDALAQSLKAAWPGPGERVKAEDYCPKCNNYGLILEDCPGDATCGRSKQHLPHDYGTPCWCVLGKRFITPAKGGDEDFTGAGKVKPARRPAWARVGR